MTRPDSYNDDPPVNRCASCKFSHVIRYREDLLCFHGDEIKAERDGDDVFATSTVDFNGDCVELLEGDEYSKVWGGRMVSCDAVCDEWEKRDDGKDR